LTRHQHRRAGNAAKIELVRNLVYSMMVSLDGFVERSEGTDRLDWVIIDKELHEFANDQARAAGAFLYGRGMYENMAAFWPTADTTPGMPGYVVDFARIWKPKPKIVFSRTLDKVEWNSRLVKENVADEISKLKREPGGELSVGGARFASTVIELGLIDEYQLFVHPAVIGGGTPYFPPRSAIDLRLVETQTFGSGVVYLRYEARS
jgi:dihydrofolate reductase